MTLEGEPEIQLEHKYVVSLHAKKVTHNVRGGVVGSLPAGTVMGPYQVEGGPQVVLPSEHQVGTELGKTEIGIPETPGCSPVIKGIAVAPLIKADIQ